MKRALAASILTVLATGSLLALTAPEPARLLPAPTALYTHNEPKVPLKTDPMPGRWDIVYHGTCCEGNLAAAGDDTYVLLPVLVTGNKIERSSDNGKTWEQRYPPADASVPFGIEGDMLAYGDDVIFFGTELAVAVVAHSRDRGETFTPVQVPVIPAVNDQAWAYLGPMDDVCPVQSAPYVLAGWFRIGAALIFSCDGGVTWPIQTPLQSQADPNHLVCRNSLSDPADGGDRRVANANFAINKAGRHGAWGTDRRFFWSSIYQGELHLCRTADFGVTWEGTRHPIADGEGNRFVVTHTAFDDAGTLYVMHGDKLYISFDQGHSFRYTHTMPRFGNAASSDSGADQYFAVRNGQIHVALIETRLDNPESAVIQKNIIYMIGHDLASDTPRWHVELVDVTDPVRLDFMQLAINGQGVPTMSYTTPAPSSDPMAVREVTTAALNTTAPFASLTVTSEGLEARFDASASSALDGLPVSYRIEYGDGQASTGATQAVVEHRYAAAGSYRARVSVTDSQGQISVREQNVTVSADKSAPAKQGSALLAGGLGGALLLPVLLLALRRHL